MGGKSLWRIDFPPTPYFENKRWEGNRYGVLTSLPPLISKINDGKYLSIRIVDFPSANIFQNYIGFC